jgi:hypothetical protein
MMDIATETRLLIEAVLDGDPCLASLAVNGETLATLRASIVPGLPASKIGGASYHPRPPFERQILVELVVRLQRLRWRRFDATTRTLLPPTEEDLRALRDRHVHASVGFECGAGWTDLLGALFAWLAEIAPHHEWEPVQVKEKFGTLRFYWSGALPDEARPIVDASEHLSSSVCDVCGSPGMLQDDGG